MLSSECHLSILVVTLDVFLDKVLNNEMTVIGAVFENTYFMFFFQISKKHDFLRFFEMTYQKVVKSL